MKKKTIVILLIIVCCLVLVLCGCESSDSNSDKGSGTLYSGGNNLATGTMLPNELTVLEWQGGTDIKGNDTTCALSSQEFTGEISGIEETAKAYILFVVNKNENDNYLFTSFHLMFTGGLEYLPRDCTVSFSNGNENYNYVPTVTILWVGPANVCVTCSDENIGNLFKNSADDQEIQIRVVDNVTGNYIGFNVLKGNFDEVYFAE